MRCLVIRYKILVSYYKFIYIRMFPSIRSAHHQCMPLSHRFRGVEIEFFRTDSTLFFHCGTKASCNSPGIPQLTNSFFNILLGSAKMKNEKTGEGVGGSMPVFFFFARRWRYFGHHVLSITINL